MGVQRDDSGVAIEVVRCWILDEEGVPVYLLGYSLYGIRMCEDAVWERTNKLGL